MEPISSILLKAAGKLADKAVADSYQAIKNYVNQKLGQDNKVNKAIESAETSPNSKENQQQLERAVAEQGLQQDSEFQALLKRLEANSTAVNIQTNISGDAKVQGVVGSTNVSVGEMNFSND